jgi:ribonuclease J
MQTGGVLETDGVDAKIVEPIPVSGSIMVDGLGVGDVSEVVLRDRWHLAQDGVLVVVLTIDGRSGEVLVGPDIISRGVFAEESAEALLAEARSVILDEVNSMDREEVIEWAAVKADVRKALGRFLYDRIRRRPMIVPVIMET